ARSRLEGGVDGRRDRGRAHRSDRARRNDLPRRLDVAVRQRPHHECGRRALSARGRAVLRFLRHGPRALFRVAERGPARLALARRAVAHDDRDRWGLARGAIARAHRPLPGARIGARRVRSRHCDRDRCGRLVWACRAPGGVRRPATLVRSAVMLTKTETKTETGTDTKTDAGTRLYLEDFAVGQIFRSGSLTVEVADIKAFATQYDPQPFHLDEAAAKATLFAGLAASGWPPAALTMRLLVDGGAPIAGGIIGAGTDELRWPRPVRPGDQLRVESEVLEIQPSRTRPQGRMKLRTTTLNQN